MATRSYVGIINPKIEGEEYQTIRYIYVHNDGSPATRLPILIENYDTPEKVNALLDLGDLSALYPKMDKPKGHSFKTPVDGYTIAYGRDRGETGIKAKKAYWNDYDRQPIDMDRDEYIYLFDTKLNKWIYFYPEF